MRPNVTSRSRESFLNRARNYGPATVQVLSQIMDRNQIEAQTYLPCRNILSELGGKKASLEEACQEMLNINRYATYTSLKRVMATLAAAKALPTAAAPAARNVKNLKDVQNLSGVFVRDAEHYKGFGGTSWGYVAPWA